MDQHDTSLRGNHVLLRAGTLRLLLPDTDVGAARYLETRPSPTDQPGILEADGEAFAALSDRMTLLPVCPPERFVAASLASDATGIGWCWDELRVLIGIEVETEELPPVLVGPDTPVRRVADVEGRPAFVCRASDVTTFALAARS